MPEGTRRTPTGSEPAVTTAATSDDAPPSATDAVAPGVVVASTGVALASATDPPSSDGEVPDVPRRPGLPRLALVAIVAGSLVLVLAGARSTSGIIGPAFLALVLTITVHPVRRALVRRNVPDWLVAVAVVVSVYLLLISVSLALVVSAGRLAQLLPQYTDEFDKYTAEVTSWLASLGVTEDQASSVGSVDRPEQPGRPHR